MNFNKFSFVLLSVAVIFLATAKIAEACVLCSSPWSYSFQDIFSSMFGCEADEPQKLMYDRASEKWVEKCPEIKCDHGTDDGDDDMCPSCLLGPEAECGDWVGKCGNEMVCQYSSMFSCSGKCVWEADFLSRKAGESCGEYEGKCGSGLKCRVDSSPWAYFCGYEEDGVCVTKEQFASRQEGETCGESAGECMEGLTCVGSDYCWTQATCKNSTSPCTSPTSDNDEFVTIEIFNDDSEEPNKSEVIETLLEFEKEVFPNIPQSALAEEEKVIEEILETGQDSSSSDGREEIIFEIIKTPDVEKVEEDLTTISESANKLGAATSNENLKVVLESPAVETSVELVVSDGGKQIFSSTVPTRDEPMVLPLPGRTNDNL